jgi:hypothetical protein
LERPDDNPGPGLVIEPAVAAAMPEADDAETTTDQAIPAPIWTEETGIEIIRATRSWIQYGTVGFAVMCIVIGAVEGLFGR